jgi:hypothetical protein
MSEIFSVTLVDWSASHDQDNGFVQQFILQCAFGNEMAQGGGGASSTFMFYSDCRTTCLPYTVKNCLTFMHHQLYAKDAQLHAG